MRKLKDWLQGYMQYTQHAEAPEHFQFWTGVSVIASALGRKTWIDMKYFQLAPNSYIIQVAPPGIGTKSTSIDIGKRFLIDVKGIKFGPSALTWQSLVQELSDSSEAVLMPDGNLFTISSLNFYVSELGTLLDMQDKRMLDCFTDFWDCKAGPWEKSTKGQGREKIMTPWVNILAGTTPTWLSTNVPKQMVGGGFTSRCIFVFGNRKRNLVAYPQRIIDPVWMALLGEKLLHDLEQIVLLKGEFTLTDEAFQFGDDWYKTHWAKAYKVIDSQEDYGGYMSRKQAHVHKLAMILSSAKRDDLIIDKDTLDTAIKLIDVVELGLPKVFQSMTTVDGQEKTLRLIEVVKTRGQIELSELYQIFIREMDLQTYKNAIGAAIQAGLVDQVQHGVKHFLVWKVQP